MKATLLSLVSVISLCFHVHAADTPISGNLLQLQGTWTVETATEDGKSVPPLVGTRFFFKGDKLTIELSGGKTLTSVVKILPATSLKRIAIEPDPPKPGCTSQNNAYELTGETFTLIQATPPKVPEDLSDRGQQRLVLKRKAP